MGVFPVINRINHSCVPNCSVQWNPISDKEELFTVREVDAGEELTICYLDLVTNVSSRQGEILLVEIIVELRNFVQTLYNYIYSSQGGSRGFDKC